MYGLHEWMFRVSLRDIQEMGGWHVSRIIEDNENVKIVITRKTWKKIPYKILIKI
jgi:hypothetical protein